MHAYSVGNAPQFWADVWDFCGVIAETRGERLVVDEDKMPGARYFPGAVLNFAENLLRRSDNSVALVYADETGTREQVTFAQLREQVASMAAALAAGIELAMTSGILSSISTMPVDFSESRT